MTEIRPERGKTRQSLVGQHALITGGGRGIGGAVAETLAGAGADVTLLGRDLETLEAKKAELATAHGVRIFVSAADVTDTVSVEAAFEAVRKAMGAPTILVNNAGGAESAPFKRTDPELWARMLALNLTGTYLATQLAVPAMVEAGFGRIVNIASTAGLKGYAYVSAYCAAKHGVIGLTRALALELAKTGVTVNAVCPGYTDTDLVAGAVETIAAKTGTTAEKAKARLAQENPQGRLIQPEEVAETVLWLCGTGAAAITGQAIAVAGGEVM